MSQPVKLSDRLVLDARLTGEAMERSIAGQVEFWARLGRAVDLLLGGRRALQLCTSGKAESLFDSLVSVDTDEGRARVANYLETRPFPHFAPFQGKQGLLERIDKDGTRTVGRFINREFTPMDLPITLDTGS